MYSYCLKLPVFPVLWSSLFQRWISSSWIPSNFSEASSQIRSISQRYLVTGSHIVSCTDSNLLAIALDMDIFATTNSYYGHRLSFGLIAPPILYQLVNEFLCMVPPPSGLIMLFRNGRALFVTPAMLSPPSCFLTLPTFSTAVQFSVHLGAVYK